MTRTLNRNATDGYRAIMYEIRMGDFGDPWGTTMGWLFALAEVLFVEFDETVPDFRPSIAMHTRDDLEGYEQETLIEFIDRGLITEDDMIAAFTIMNRYDEWLRLAGKNY